MVKIGAVPIFSPNFPDFEVTVGKIAEALDKPEACWYVAMTISGIV